MIALTLPAQEASTEAESQLADLKKRLKHQESETRKAEAKSKFSLDELEKLKPGFAADRNARDEEKAALVQRVKYVEASLKEVTAELSGLKRHISQITTAIFGKKF